MAKASAKASPKASAKPATEETKKFRLVTRSDFDGLVCGILLRELDMIADVKFVHPKDVQDGKVELSKNDVTTNLPFDPRVHLAFDHHASELKRVGANKNYVTNPNAPSAARVVYQHFGGRERFPKVSDAMMEAVDQADSAQYDIEDISRPGAWTLLNFIMDPRTGLGRFKDFRVANYQLMMDLMGYCRDKSIDEILKHPDVKERVDLYHEHEHLFNDQLVRCGRMNKNLLVLDLRKEEVIYAGNRFMCYALYPKSNISMHIMWGKDKSNTVFAVGKSILKRDSRTNVGELMLKYGGGGHVAAGTCQVANSDAEKIKAELVAAITADG
jgi:nanoRNase/pAp phosphatase (c-di-AMP/oligoRNAs hydrolase)